MNLRDKEVLVVGLARSGIATVKILRKIGARVIANDLKHKDELGEACKELENVDVKWALGESPDSYMDRADLIVISPGVPIDLPFIKKAMEMNIEVISEIELASRLCKAPIIAITGTNGKTTTTALVGEIFKETQTRSYVVGNIGVPFIGMAMEAQTCDVVVAEVSSFQLEAVSTFHPRVATVLNITEDHLNRHKTMETYVDLKMRVFQNSSDSDWVILGWDDPLSRGLGYHTRGNTLYFSRKETLDKGAWVEDGWIYLNIGNAKEKVCRVQDVRMPGTHNLENALAAALIARIMGIELKVIEGVLKKFPGVEHRIELVDTIDNVTFYNDSKGTNIDATLKAIGAMDVPTVLIAGGYDKDSDFHPLIDGFGGTINHLIVLGETADRITKAARDKGFSEITKVKTLEEGVIKAFSFAVPGGNVLLSPSCASWDMFKDFEERGRVFKEAVGLLKGER